MYIITPYDCKDLLNEDPTASKSENNVQSTIADFASWRPTYTQPIPERVVLFRTVALAKRSYNFLLNCLADASSGNWTATFRETQTSLKSFSLLLRVDSDFILDAGFSSTKDCVVFRQSVGGHLESIFTRSARNRYEGPKVLRRKIYRNLNSPQMHFILVSLIVGWALHGDYS
jgi:hypothetical protein